MEEAAELPDEAAEDAPAPARAEEAAAGMETLMPIAAQSCIAKQISLSAHRLGIS